jgi:peptidoglycan/xylan/chitin deacetylase (PgdA/CDA1 family)
VPVAHSRANGADRRIQRPALAQARAIGTALHSTPTFRHGGSRRREIALTFDDGPGPYTRQILAILTRTHTPATFFIVGQQLTSYPRVLQAELRSGAAIGDHTENHPWLIRLGRAGQFTQIVAAALRVRRLGGGLPRMLRPPYGVFNATTLAVARSLGMVVVLWSDDPSDYARPGAAVIVRRVLGAARPGAIVLLHDAGGPRQQTVAALRPIIDGLRRRGYRLVTVPQMLRDDPPARSAPQRIDSRRRQHPSRRR